ncbi:unnamed protein product [Auanema sp. JU1783]|nr:unnamed protein product [Auanema sp. JU1783]
MLFMLICLIQIQIGQTHERSAEDCELDLRRGTAGPNKGFRYYYDKELAMCFKYYFEGNDEGYNSFATEDDCFAYCIPQDYNTCGANKSPNGFCSDLMKCPDHSSCRFGGFGFGICCDKQTEEDWNNDYTPKCENGGEVVQLERWWGKTELLGKSCDHKFCPGDSTCHSGKWLSYCCKSRSRANRVKGESRQIIAADSPTQASMSY